MSRYPVHVRASRDLSLSRWLWAVKWLLLIPHYLVLVVLWVAFAALTLIAYVAVLFTGRYPHAIFVFNVGVLRWTWRVGFYGYQVLGTDQYPPFTLAEVPGYPAGLLIDAPSRPPRWLPLVAWLFAVPHLLILGALTGAGGWRVFGDDTNSMVTSFSVVGAGVLVVALSLAVRGSAPRGLHDLLVGVARWSLRVLAYVALLTVQYPPFRLDQGDNEPDPDPLGPLDAPNAVTTVVQPPLAPAAGRGAAGRALVLVVGVFLLLAAAGVGIGGGALLALGADQDAEGFVTSQTLDVGSPTAAVTAEGIEIQAGDAWSHALLDYGQVRITVSSPTSTPLFVGIARQSDVDGWLAGAAHDQLADTYAGSGARFHRTAGPIGDVSAPAGQDFWLASGSGTGTVVLDWQATDGRFAVVLTNGTGTRGVTATARIATRIPDPTMLGAGLLGGAAALTLLAFVLIYLGATGLARRHTGPTGPAAIPPTGPTPRPPADPRIPVDVRSGGHAG